MNKTFTIDNRTFKQVPSTNGCIGCAGSFSTKVHKDITDELCLAISEYVSEKPFKSCTGQGVIYMEVKNV